MKILAVIGLLFVAFILWIFRRISIVQEISDKEQPPLSDEDFENFKDYDF